MASGSATLPCRVDCACHDFTKDRRLLQKRWVSFSFKAENTFSPKIHSPLDQEQMRAAGPRFPSSQAH